MSAIDSLLADARRSRSLPPPPLRRLLRERVGLSQQDVADTLGVDRTAVTRWECGTRVPRRAARLAYVELLDRLAEEGDDG